MLLENMKPASGASWLSPTETERAFVPVEHGLGRCLELKWCPSKEKIPTISRYFCCVCICVCKLFTLTSTVNT